LAGVLASAAQQQATNARAFFEINVWLLAHLALILAATWAIRINGLVPTLLLASCGGLASVFLTGQFTSWKGQLGYVTVLFLLALATTLGPVACGFVLVGGVILGAASDARNQTLVALAALAVTVMSPRFVRHVRARPVRISIRITAALTTITAATVYGMGAGWFGAEIQRRSLAQSAQRGNALEGARTEWAATLDLFKHQPWGFGAGVSASDALEGSAIAAAGRAGGDTLGPYFQENVFGTRVDLHSIAANLWFHFGLPGVALVALFLLGCIYGLTVVIADDRIRSLITFCILSGVWDFLFSPAGNADRLILGAASAIFVAGDALRTAVITEELSRTGPPGYLRQRTPVISFRHSFVQFRH
jgi:O-antigen ligase